MNTQPRTYRNQGQPVPTSGPMEEQHSPGHQQKRRGRIAFMGRVVLACTIGASITTMLLSSEFKYQRQFHNPHLVEYQTRPEIYAKLTATPLLFCVGTAVTCCPAITERICRIFSSDEQHTTLASVSAGQRKDAECVVIIDPDDSSTI